MTSRASGTQASPEISVVIIFLNAGPFLEEAMASVCAQTFADWELVLVDDGSTDGSSAMARAAAAREARVRYLDHPGHVNLGTSASRNVGLNAAQGRSILFLDGDDVLFDTALATLNTRLIACPQAAAVFASTLFWQWAPEFADRESRIQSYGRCEGLHPPPGFLTAMVGDENLHPANCSSLMRLAELREIGGFEADFRGMYEDTVLLAKLLARYPVLVIEEVVSAYRLHPASQCHQAAAEGSYDRHAPNAARGAYLKWLRHYIDAQHLGDRRLRRVLDDVLRAYRWPVVSRLASSYKVRTLVHAWRTWWSRKAERDIRLRSLAAAAALARTQQALAKPQSS